MSKLCTLACWVAFSVPGQRPTVDALEEAHAEALVSWERRDARQAANVVRATFAVPGVPHSPPDVAHTYLVRATDYGHAPPLAHTAYPVDPRTTVMLFDFARFLQADGDHRAAIHLLEMFLNRNPRHADAHLAVADSRWEVGDQQDARRHYRIYLSLVGET